VEGGETVEHSPERSVKWGKKRQKREKKSIRIQDAKAYPGGKGRTGTEKPGISGKKKRTKRIRSAEPIATQNA